MAKLKVLHVINGLWPGGAQIMLLRLCEEFKLHNVQNEVFSLTKKDTIKPQLEALGVKCHQGGILGLRRLICNYSPDAIQGWMYHSDFAITCATPLTKHSRNIFWSVHHTIDDIDNEKFSSRLVIKLLKSVSRHPNKIVYVSKTSMQQHEDLGYERSNSVFIPNGYDLEMFRKDESLRQQFRKEHGITNDTFLIGTLARFHKMKDHKTFLDAAAFFSSKIDNCGFIIAGRGTKNKQMAKWIEERGLVDKVMVLGDRRDVCSILNGLDLLATSSRYGEAFPIVIGEAMACEVACCATKVGDTELLIGEPDLISIPGDPVALSENWIKIASLSTMARDDLGKKLRKRINDHFKLSVIAEKYLALYTRFTRYAHHK